MSQGQDPKTLFVGCSDSRLAPCLLTGTGSGALFIVHNVGGHSQCVGIRATYEGVPHEAAPLKA